MLFVISCSTPWIRSNPPSLQKNPADSATTPDGRPTGGIDDIDFADAFDTTIAIGDSPDLPPPRIDNIPVNSLQFTPFGVPFNRVRIALLQNIARTVVYSVGTVRFHSPKRPVSESFRGRILLEARKGNGVTVTAGQQSVDVTLPCTLLSDNEYNFLEIGDTTYRGAMIIAAGRSGTITVINFLEVEEYLRGVVPLELGRRPREEIEALKAQAVAARTYTYRRILERKAEPFDMVSTVADQVYGGAAVEYREADAAIYATKNLIMTDGDSIIYAYYHSTCGGTTADVHDVWGKPAQPYLRSVPDLDESGKAWCRGSTYFIWEESWPWKQFSTLVIASLQKMEPQTRFKGVVNGLTVDERFSCGRVKRATVTGSGWAHECGGDQIRFILRRGTAGNPILRSANFTVTSPDRATIRLKGKGYGHGVGMCQMGAVGRAQAGQHFVTILRSYYNGVSIVTATAER